MKIAIIGLGYVGLPLAVELSKHENVLGFDLNKKRVKELNSNIDRNNQISNIELEKQRNETLQISSFETNLSDCSIFIVTVPTPVDENDKPDLSPLHKASHLISKYLKKGDIVIYESTVYPGCTEDFCIPILENFSKLKLNLDFGVGYSPERINPGDSENNLINTVKIVSGSNSFYADKVKNLYDKIIKNTYLAKTIKIAESSKILENTQRDVNIAFINEISKLFNKLDIDTNEVLKAAGTKWNFVNVRPGLVGGHCIGVDPYYLIHKANEVNVDLKITSNSREINDRMFKYVYLRILDEAIKRKTINYDETKILFLGCSFKPNVSDIRNSQIFKLINIFKQLDYIKIDLCDYMVNKDELEDEYKYLLKDDFTKNKYDIIILSVGHNDYLKIDLIKNLNNKGFIFDLSNNLEKSKMIISL